jgi:hypothetical protein
MLTGYFEYNNKKRKPDEPKSLYQDFPRHYVRKQQKKCLEPRKTGFAIGKIPYCSPVCGERFYLRLLLTTIPGATSFEDIKTVDGHECEIYKQACLELHLIEDDQEWSRCFEEACIFSSGSSLRDLFITAPTFDELVDPVSLSITYRDSICDDLAHKLSRLFPRDDKYTIVDETIFFYHGSAALDYGLFLLQTKLEDLEHSLSEYGLQQE